MVMKKPPAQTLTGSLDKITMVKKQDSKETVGEVTDGQVRTIDSIEDETEYMARDGIQFGSRTMIGANTQMKQQYGGNVQTSIQIR